MPDGAMVAHLILDQDVLGSSPSRAALLAYFFLKKLSSLSLGLLFSLTRLVVNVSV